MVAKRHKITNVPLFKKLWDIIFFFWDNHFMSFARDNLRGQKSLDPLKMSLEMAHKVIVPQKKNYVPQFLKQREINSYNGTGFVDKFPTMLLLI
jgi:hypothetical protein